MTPLSDISRSPQTVPGALTISRCVHLHLDTQM